MRLGFLLATLSWSSLSGCGASMSELVAQERWYEACDAFDGDDARYVEKSDYLFGSIATRADARVTTHVFTREELSELLPHVPARMASGEVVLVATEAVETSSTSTPAAAREARALGVVFPPGVPPRRG